MGRLLDHPVHLVQHWGDHAILLARIAGGRGLRGPGAVRGIIFHYMKRTLARPVPHVIARRRYRQFLKTWGGKTILGSARTRQQQTGITPANPPRIPGGILDFGRGIAKNTS